MEIVMYGASGHTLAVAQSIARDFGGKMGCQVIAFIEDGLREPRTTSNGVQVISFQRWHADYRSLKTMIGIGSPAGRKRLAERVRSHGGAFPRLYHEGLASRFPFVDIGEGTLVADHTYVGPQTRIGNHTQVMPMTSIGHDVVIGDFVTICPGCTISGHVVIEDGVYVGAGTVIVNGRAGSPLKIGRGTTISAGAVVTKPIPADVRVAGNPARRLREIALERRRR